MNRKNVKTRWLVVVWIVLFTAGQGYADTVWDSGHHEILDGQTYGELWMHNDAIADMWGGYIRQLGTQGTSVFNMYGGTVDMILGRYNSTVNIHGGILNNIGLGEDAYINLYAYDVVIHPGGEYDNGWLEGKYINNDQYFSLSLGYYDTSHINIIPEPATLLLLGLGGIFIKKKH